MPAPKGNKFGRGKKGVSGRKSYYEEVARAEALVDAWFHEGLNIDSLKAEVEEGLKGKTNLKLFKLYLAKAVKSEKILMDMAQKLFPNKTGNVETDTNEINVNVNIGMYDHIKNVLSKVDPKEKKKTLEELTGLKLPNKK